MKLLTILFILINILFSSTATVFAGEEKPDNRRGVITAVIVDSKTNEPISFANVTLHSASDSSMVNGAASGVNGELLLSNIPDGNYFAKISYIGYEKKLIPGIEISKEKKEISLGTIKLNSADVLVGTVNVVGEKASEELHLDKKIINVSQNLNAAGGTALDVLQNQPSIQVDQDGNVSLRGSSNFTVLVNGKPNPLQGGDALRQIPASLIENIEIITNPSAKYDAEGAAGIINIVMKKTNDTNLNGIVNAGLGSRTKYNGDFTINYKYGDLSWNGSFDYRKNTNFINQFFERTVYGPNYSFINSGVNGKIIRDNYTAKGGVDYSITEKSSVSVTASYGQVSVDRGFFFKTSDFGGGNGQNPTFNLVDDDNSLDAKYFNSTLYFSQQFTPKVDELVFEATYTNLGMPSSQSTREYTTDQNFNPVSNQPLTQELKNDTGRDEGRIKLNYSYNFSPKSKFETGIQANLFYRTFDIVSRKFDWNTNQWQINPTYTNLFDFRNNVYSAFAMYTNEIAGFDYQLGLRVEQTDRLLQQKTLNKDFKYNQTHLFPSLNISTKIAETNQIQFSYSIRINRPFEFALNPFPSFSTTYVTQTGNPELLPELTNSFELNFQKFMQGVFFSIQTYFRNTNNSILQTQALQSDGSTLLSFGNVAKTNSYGAEISSSITLIPWLRIDPSINLFQRNMSGTIDGAARESEIFSWSSRLNTTLIFCPSTRLQVMLNYVGKQKDLQSTIDPILFLTLSLRQEFLDRKLIATIVAQNLFNTGRFDLVSSGNNFIMGGKIRPEAPVFRLTLSYNFNNYKSTAKTNDRVDINVGEGL